MLFEEKWKKDEQNQRYLNGNSRQCQEKNITVQESWRNLLKLEDSRRHWQSWQVCLDYICLFIIIMFITFTIYFISSIIIVITTIYHDCMFLSCHVHVSEWIYTLYLPESQGLLSSPVAVTIYHFLFLNYSFYGSIKSF